MTVFGYTPIRQQDIINTINYQLPFTKFFFLFYTVKKLHCKLSSEKTFFNNIVSPGYFSRVPAKQKENNQHKRFGYNGESHPKMGRGLYE